MADQNNNQSETPAGNNLPDQTPPPQPPQKSAFAEAVDRYGAYAVGFLGAIGALVFAYFLPANRQEIVGAAGTIAIFTLLFSNGKRFGLRLLGMLGAAACGVAAIFMPDQAKELLSTAGTIAIFSLIFA
jgi:hypothetical protein